MSLKRRMSDDESLFEILTIIINFLMADISLKNLQTILSVLI